MRPVLCGDHRDRVGREPARQQVERRRSDHSEQRPDIGEDPGHAPLAVHARLRWTKRRGQFGEIGLAVVGAEHPRRERPVRPDVENDSEARGQVPDPQLSARHRVAEHAAHRRLRGGAGPAEDVFGAAEWAPGSDKLQRPRLEHACVAAAVFSPAPPAPLVTEQPLPFHVRRVQGEDAAVVRCLLALWKPQDELVLPAQRGALQGQRVLAPPQRQRMHPSLDPPSRKPRLDLVGSHTKGSSTPGRTGSPDLARRRAYLTRACVTMRESDTDLRSALSPVRWNLPARRANAAAFQRAGAPGGVKGSRAAVAELRSSMSGMVRSHGSAPSATCAARTSSNTV